MTRPLLQTQNEIESRLTRLQQTLNGELGFRDQRLRFMKRTLRTGSIKWELVNHAQNPATALQQGVVAKLASAAHDNSILYFGYNEEWQRQHQNRVEFVASNLRFVIAGVEDTPDFRFRLEWAGAKTHDGGIVAYPGSGAAHPHWQFDVDSGWMASSFLAEDISADRTIEINLEPAVEEIDLSEGGATPVYRARQISATLASFHRLHLPARTMWHDILCEMPGRTTPQQHTPESGDQIDRWIVSALRYLKSEFEAYM